VAAQLGLDGGQQVVSLVLLELEVGVAGDPEGMVGDHLHAGEERVQAGGDHLLHRDEASSIGHRDETRQQRRYLDSRESVLALARLTHQHSQVQREVGDVREGVSRVDRERGQHREDAILEESRQPIGVIALELGGADDADAVHVELRHDLVAEDLGLAGHRVVHLLADGMELLGGAHAVGRGAGHAGADLLGETGDTNLEELVHRLADDGKELCPLQQRHRGVFRLRQDPFIEFEPRQFGVDVAQLGSRRGTPVPLWRRATVAAVAGCPRCPRRGLVSH